MNKDAIVNKIIGTAVIVSGVALTATKTLIFAKASMEVSKRVNPFVGFIVLMGIEYASHQAASFVKEKI